MSGLMCRVMFSFYIILRQLAKKIKIMWKPTKIVKIKHDEIYHVETLCILVDLVANTGYFDRVTYNSVMAL